MTDAVGRPSPAAGIGAELSQLQVTPENVLLIGSALQAEAILLEEKIYRAIDEAVVREPGQDPVSLDAVPQINNKITALLTGQLAYVNALAEAAAQMTQIARRYGHTEQEIQDSFTRYQQANPPPTSPGPA